MRVQKGVHNVTTVCKELQHSTDVHDRRFDLIVSSMVLHHVEHAQATITLLATLLRTDGVLMICDLLKTADGVDHFHSAHALKHGGVFHQGGFTDDDMKGTGHTTRVVGERTGDELASLSPFTIFSSMLIPPSRCSLTLSHGLCCVYRQ